MHVATILKDKGRSVYSARPHDPIVEVCRLLSEKRIGTVVILDDRHHLVGILSERDIVRAIAEDGPGVLARPVADIMTAKVFTCTENDTINHIMELMTARRIRHVPVVEQGRVAGLISIGDVVKHKIAQTELEAQALKEYIAAY